jgi:hypothetical protein
MITSREATEVARRWGLTLSDAAALARLAEDVAEGNAIAEQFTTPAVPQIGREALKSMSPAEINEAHANGALKNLLEGGVEGGEAK